MAKRLFTSLNQRRPNGNRVATDHVLQSLPQRESVERQQGLTGLILPNQAIILQGPHKILTTCKHLLS